MNGYEKSLKTDRKKMDGITKKLVKLIAERNRVSGRIGVAKAHLGIKVYDRKREEIVMKHAIALSEKENVDKDLVMAIFKLLFRSSRRSQK